MLGAVERELKVTVEELSGAGVRLRSTEQVPVSAPVKLEWDDAMFLGECVHTAPAPGGGYVVGIHFEQVIGGLQDLRNLMARLSAEAEVAGSDTGIRQQANSTTAWQSRKARRQD